MRKFAGFYLILLWTGLALGQTMVSPPKTTSVPISTTQPTFKWTQVANATVYQLYFTSNAADTTLANSQSSPAGSKAFISTGTTASDTTYALTDTVLALNTEYYWKVRARVNGAWTSWTYPMSYFEVGAPNYSMSNANASIAFNQDTLGGITSVKFAGGSNQELLDTTYNAAHNLGLGGDGAQPDTIVSWYTSANADTNIFTYINGALYGAAGSKVLTVSSGTDGITANIALTLAPSKTVSVATAWTPGGSASGTNDDVLLSNSSGATNVALTYPASAASFGPDSINLSAMYDTQYNEYFGFKSSSPMAVADTQATGLLKQVLSFSNSGASAETFNYSFAVRSTRSAYFSTWAGNTPLIVTKPAAGDSLATSQITVVWQSFGATPDSISFSSDGGVTFGSPKAISGDTASVDSATYLLPSGPAQSNCVIEVISPDGVGISGVFKVAQHNFSITYPATGNVVPAGQSYVVWNNPTGSGVEAIQVSLDSGKTWTNTTAISPVDSAITDSALFSFTAPKNGSASAMVRIYTNASDTAETGLFTIGTGGAIFSVPTAYGSPGEVVAVPIHAQDFAVADSISSFDLRMNYDTTYVTFDSVSWSPLLKNPYWVAVAVDSVASTGGDSSYVRFAAFESTAGYGITDSTVAKVYFSVKNKESIIGQVDTLKIVNPVLAASGDNAISLNVSSSTNGLFKVYSSISGNVSYFVPDTSTAFYSISGDSLMVFHDRIIPANDTYFTSDSGRYDMTNLEPNDSVTYYPSASVYTAAGWNSINVVDADLAFLSFENPLSTRQLIAADVNGDSVVNSTDVEMIMNIAVDSTYLKSLGLSNWIFIDSTALVAVEHSSDSLSAFYSAEQDSDSALLTNQLTNQNFFGVLRGDVNFSYGDSINNISTARSMTMKLKGAPRLEVVASSSVLFSTSAEIGAQAGDTVWIPLNIDPGSDSLGGFDATIQVNPQVMTYTGIYKMGPVIPQNTNWYVAAHCTKTGLLSIAALDFAIHIAPIKTSGTALEFGFVVNSNVENGTSFGITIQTQTVVNPAMQNVPSRTEGGQVQVTGNGVAVPKSFGLSQNYPNPFNPTTTIRFDLPADSKVNLTIYNVLGEKIATLVDGTVSAGYHYAVWNASRFASGVYFSVLRCSSVTTGQNFHSVKKLMYLK